MKLYLILRMKEASDLALINNRKENTESKYYVIAVNEFKEWNIDILESKPDNW